MSLIDQQIAELSAASGPFGLQLEGFRDLVRCLVKPDEVDAQVEVQMIVDRYDQRRAKLQAALDALTALRDDEYPRDLPQAVSADVFAKIKAQVDSVSAAFTEVSAQGDAASGIVGFGPLVAHP